MSDQINRNAVLSQNDEGVRENLIRQQESLILKTASGVSHKYITKADDEWSVALYAFSRAIDLYDESKGDFLPFAQMIIKRDLIDHYRRDKSSQKEISTSPFIFEGNGEIDEDRQNVYQTVVDSCRDKDNRSVKDEIIAANEMLGEYGFRFMDLTESSPQQDRTKKECAVAIRYILSRQDMMEELKKTKKLSVKEISKGSGVSKKTLDRYRRYIIMAVIILEGDYPNIAKYLRFIREEASL